MLRILLSRAALFPALGLALMAAGALFPDGAVAGIVLVVIGANVAFYSLRDFTERFEWGPDSRAMLRLCGVGFALGLALVGVAATLESRNGWVAALAAGLYLCLFAIWTVQLPVGWGWRGLAVAGSLLMALGGIAGHLAWQDWRVFAESKPDPREVPLADLVQNGFGDNRHVRVTEFRFCDRHATEGWGKNSRVETHWIPVVPVDGQAVRKDGPAPAVPPRLVAVCAVISTPLPDAGNPRLGLRAARVEARLRERREADGYEGAVITGLRPLKPEARDRLTELAPQTDWADVVILDWRKPAPADRVYSWLGGGAAAFLVGLACLGLVFRKAWKVVGSDGPPPAPVEGRPQDATPGP